MNKNLLGIFCVAAASLAASAQSVPSTYNFQGVCGTTNADVEVVFNVLANGKVVYSEAQTVRTNHDGAFTALVGNGAATVGSWDEIKWTDAEYSLQTSVDGTVVANCAMVAVPYATVAERFLGMDQLNEDLNAMDARIGAVIETMADAIAEANDEATAANVKADAYYNSLKAEAEEIHTAIDERINDNWAQTEEAIHEILSGFELLSSGVDAALANIDENSQMFTEVVESMLEQIADNQEAVEALELKTNANLQTLDEKYAEAVNNLDALINNIDENASMFNEAVDTMMAQIEENKEAALAANIKADTYYTSVKAEMEENFGGAQDAITDIYAQLANIDENSQMFTEVVESMLEQIADNQEAVEALEGKTDAYLQTLDEKYAEAVNNIDAQLANIDENSTMANEIIDKLLLDVDDINEGLNGLDARYGELFEKYGEAIETINAQIANMDENTVMANEIIDTLLTDVDGLKDRLEGYENIKENLEMLVPVIEHLNSSVENLNAQIANMDENAALSNEIIDTLLVDVNNLKDMLEGYDNIKDNLEMLVPVIEHLTETTEANSDRIDALTQLMSDTFAKFSEALQKLAGATNVNIEL